MEPLDHAAPVFVKPELATSAASSSTERAQTPREATVFAKLRTTPAPDRSAPIATGAITTMIAPSQDRSEKLSPSSGVPKAIGASHSRSAPVAKAIARGTPEPSRPTARGTPGASQPTPRPDDHATVALHPLELHSVAVDAERSAKVAMPAQDTRRALDVATVAMPALDLEKLARAAKLDAPKPDTPPRGSPTVAMRPLDKLPSRSLDPAAIVPPPDRQLPPPKPTPLFARGQRRPRETMRAIVVGNPVSPPQITVEPTSPPSRKATRMSESVTSATPAPTVGRTRTITRPSSVEPIAPDAIETTPGFDFDDSDLVDFKALILDESGPHLVDPRAPTVDLDDSPVEAPRIEERSTEDDDWI